MLGRYTDCVPVAAFVDHFADRSPDLHRDSLSASHPSRLPPYFLWIVLKGMVFLARGASKKAQKSAISMPVMSSICSRNTAECHSHDIVGYVLEGQPGKRKVS